MGREKLLSFGHDPIVSLADARKKRDDAKRLLEEGVDPSVRKKLDCIDAHIKARMTFEEVADEYYDTLVDRGLAKATVRKKRWHIDKLAKPLHHRLIDHSSDEQCLRVACLMSLTIFSQGLFVVFLIDHTSVATMSNKYSLSKWPYLDPLALTLDIRNMLIEDPSYPWAQKTFGASKTALSSSNLWVAPLGVFLYDPAKLNCVPINSQLMILCFVPYGS
jgi:hypothetical protein